MKYLKSFGRFWYDFVIGDDPKIAIAVASAVDATVAVLKLAGSSYEVLPILGAVFIMKAFSVSLYVDTRARE